MSKKTRIGLYLGYTVVAIVTGYGMITNASTEQILVSVAFLGGIAISLI
jgi:hypothetical protein